MAAFLRRVVPFVTVLVATGVFLTVFATDRIGKRSQQKPYVCVGVRRTGACPFLTI